MFAAMLWIADQLLANGIHDKVEAFQRNLPNQHRAVIGQLRDVNSAVTTFNRQLH